MKESDATLDMLNKQIEKLVKKGAKKVLSADDIKKMESFIRMKQIIVSKPTEIYIDRYDHLTDKVILDTIKNKDPVNKPLKPRGIHAKKDKESSTKVQKDDKKKP